MVFQTLAGASLLSFFWADGWAKIVTGRLELIKTVLYVGLVSSVQCTVVDERNSLTISVFTLVFAWNLLRLKTEPLVRNRMSIPFFEPLNTLNSIAENMIQKRVWTKTHLCLIPFVTGKATELSPLSCNPECMPSWNCQTMMMKFFAMILQKPSLMTMSNALVRSI